MDEQQKREANIQLAELLGWEHIGIWLDDTLIGFKNGERHASSVPDFFASVDATLSTLPEGEYAVLMYPPPAEDAQHTVRIVGLNGDATAHGATRAEALANARLAMAHG